MPSPPLSELPLDQQYPPSPDNYDHYYDSYPAIVPTATPPAPPQFYTSENLYMYQDVDGIYRWADAAARTDSCMESSFPLYHVPAFASEAIPPSAHPAYQHGDFEEPTQPPSIHDNSYIFHLAQQFSDGSSRPQVQDHRSSIARASDNFLAQASSIFSDGHSSLRRGSTLDYRPSVSHQSSPRRDSRPPSRKRSRESLDEGNYHVKARGDDAHLSLANDARRLPHPHVTASQGIPSSSTRTPHLGDFPTESHGRERGPCLRPDERCLVSKHTSNKRVHRAGEEIVRQENTILSMPTWTIPDDQGIKASKKPGEQKKQALACLFCRERKIACGRPPAHNPDQTCNQCARRRIKCEYPTESRRGQHKRRRKPVEGEASGQSAIRTSSTSSVTSTTTASSSTILMTTSSSA